MTVKINEKQETTKQSCPKREKKRDRIFPQQRAATSQKPVLLHGELTKKREWAPYLPNLDSDKIL